MVLKEIERLIDQKLDQLNTAALGIVTEAKAGMRCNVLLKHKLEGYEFELFDVPVAALNFGGNVILMQPGVGDIVLLLFSRYELEEQLKNRATVSVCELLKFSLNNALIIAGVFTVVDTIPEDFESGSILIRDSNGNYIKLKPNSPIELKGDVVINGNLDVNGDLTFDEIMGTGAENGVWHEHY